MAIDYTIAAIPTLYNGIKFRSRLEARWAAFFDQLGWEYVYEPFDLGVWSPDFLIQGKDGVLIEVKPIHSIDFETTRRMSCAAVKSAGFQGELLLLGISPLPGFHSPRLGWLGERCDYDDPSKGWCFSDPPCPFAWYQDLPHQTDFCSESGSFHGRVTGLYDGGSWGDAVPQDRDRSKLIQSAWGAASNAVQWASR